MENQNPCFKCTERHMGCHSDCKKYLLWRDSYVEMQKNNKNTGYEVSDALHKKFKRFDSGTAYRRKGK